MVKLNNLFRFHKLKILFFLGCVVFFLVTLFPYNDVGDLATGKIYELSNQQVFLQFDQMSVSLIPQPGFTFSKVSVETPLLPTLKADSISLAPSLAGLLSFKPGISAVAEGLFKGRVSLTTRGDEPNKQAVMKQNIDLTMSSVDVASLVRFFESPIDLSGQLSGETSGIVDPSFLDQPEAEFDFNIAKARLLPSNIPTPIGPIPLPGFEFQSLTVAGNMKAGVIKVEKLNLGSAKDELSAKIAGQVDFRMIAGGGQVRPQVGAFDLSIELDLLVSAEQKLGTYWSILEGQISQYKRSGPDGRKSYAFRVSAPGIGLAPQISPMNR